ncbi:uncharacterized protein KRP23_8118 [Phytophthora ramorum]|uniref:uncharacterized protein n=1 Tax=Phytophthora ramorum TaxID=164328 RepID=UPI003096A619|nr:hypothetical protein KRP23_8118 [Phytophthora ramorum]
MMARRSRISPPKFRSDISSDEDAVDTNLERDLLVEIRTLVKKEKLLEQWEDKLREHGDGFADSASDSSDSDQVNVKREVTYEADADKVSLRRSRPRRS